ncbi:MAG: TonB-dependent receptor [Sphingomonadaceae bacterium]|uniref:TonB-dependent receptor domain-containing protein n=1 Tax=Thermaurantiacus sp. TaxID=2820283 RepID=UPI00298F2AC5|nr:TonB-dependent receptor [Thermaurantiacus sp.]MCS6986289.1 TonB-dependent receptor [Sphingomonadaceae bacterium]MDW8415738.1 TonB-dependent receptor [Thermaurantiacus sp.]
MPRPVLALALLATGPALAADALDLSGEELSPPITVYATRSPREAFAVPGMVTVLDRRAIDLTQPSAVSDLFRAVPSVQFNGGPRRTGQVPAVRGFGRDNVLILLDGARQSFVSGHDGRFFLDPELLVRAEAVRGPASILYGSGAVGGVLAFETADADDLLADGETAGVRVRGGGQTVNDEGLGVATLFGRSRSGAVSGVASFGLRRSGDIRLGDGRTLTSSDRIETGLATGRARLAQGVFAEAGWTGFANRAREPNNGQGLTQGGGTGPNADVDKRIRSGTMRAGLEAAPAGRAWLDAEVTLYRTASEVDEREFATGRTTLRDITTLGVSARNRARLVDGRSPVALLAGIDWWRDRQVGTDSGTSTGRRDGVPNGRSDFLGAYLQLEADLDRPLGLPGTLTLLPGLRYDRFESRAEVDARRNEDEAVSARIAGAWRPVRPLLLFATWSEAFRAPSINELYLEGIHFPVPHPILGRQRPPVFVTNRFVPNPNLVPETSRTIEAGGGLQFTDVARPGDRLELKAAWWRTRARNLIDLFVDFRFDATCFRPPFVPCSAGTTESRNVATARLNGVEVDLAWVADRFEVAGAFSHASGRDEATGSPLGILTPDRGTLDVRWKWPERRLLIGARLEAAARFDRGRDPNDIRPAYGTLDLYAAIEPAFASWLRLDVRADNVTDKAFVRTFAGVIEPGRNVRVTLTTRFGG